jgi:hypothetical protein
MGGRELVFVRTYTQPKHRLKRKLQSALPISSRSEIYNVVELARTGSSAYLPEDCGFRLEAGK